MGYIEKTHSSSGRVPSEKGYRYYVDHLIPFPAKDDKINMIEDIVKEGYLEFEQIVQKSAEILSDITNYTSFILGPEMFETRIKQLQIVTLSPATAVAILVTNTGYVENRTFSIPNNIDASDLEKMVNILNDRLYDVPLVNIPEKLNSEVMVLMETYVHDFRKSYEYLKAAFFNEHP